MIRGEWELRVAVHDPRVYSLLKITSHGPFWMQTVWHSKQFTGALYMINVEFCGSNKILDVLYG